MKDKMMTLPTWLVELVNKIDQSDDFVCKNIEDYLNGRIDNLGVARLFNLVGCLIDKVEDTQTLLNKALDRVAQSSVELSGANQRLKREETETSRLRDRLAETQCQLVTKENELSMADAELVRLKALREKEDAEIVRCHAEIELMKTERDEAQEAARYLWRGYFFCESEDYQRIVAKYPWLETGK